MPYIGDLIQLTSMGVRNFYANVLGFYTPAMDCLPRLEHVGVIVDIHASSRVYIVMVGETMQLFKCYGVEFKVFGSNS